MLRRSLSMTSFQCAALFFHIIYRKNDNTHRIKSFVVLSAAKDLRTDFTANLH